MAQSKTIQLLRSSQLYTPSGEGANAKTALENAKAALTDLTGRKDGEIVLARYQEATGPIKSVLGIYHKSPDLAAGEGDPTSISAGWTFIQDITSSSEGLQELQNEVNAIETALGIENDGTWDGYNDNDIVGDQTTITGTIDEIIEYIKGLDLTEVGGTSGDVITAVSQADGKVSATASTLTDVLMTGYSKTADAGAIAATDTLEQAFSKVENAIAAGNVHSNDQSITVAADATNGGTNIEVNVDGTTIVKDSTLHALKSGLTLTKITSGLSTNVKEAYQLQNASGTQIGAQIDIYKDSALQEVYLGASTDTIDSSTGVITKNTVTDPQSMNFAYQLADGTYSLTKIDVSKFLTDSEFGDGLQVSGGVVSVKVGNGLEISDVGAVKVKRDSTCESFLTVGPDGVKLSGVQDAIDAVKVTTNNTGATYVNLAVDNATGRALTLTNTMQAMATADSTHQGLAEASDVKTYVDNAVQAKNVSAEGDNYVSATAANNEVTIATDVQNLTFTQGSGSTDSTLSGTANSLADGSDIATKVSSFTNARISEEIAKLDGSATATAASGDVYTVLTSVTETDGVIAKGGEVTLAAVAKTGAAADVSVAADATSGLAAGNVQDTLETLTTAVGDGLNSVSSGNGAIGVAAKSNKNQAISLVLDTATGATTDMLAIGSNGLSISNTWDCGTF